LLREEILQRQGGGKGVDIWKGGAKELNIPTIIRGIKSWRKEIEGEYRIIG